MLNSHIRFLIPNGTTLNAIGNYILPLQHYQDMGKTAAYIEDGEDVIEIVKVENSRVTINILKENADFTIRVTDETYTYFDTATYNTGSSSESFDIPEEIQVNYDARELIIPYTIKGFSPNNIEIIDRFLQEHILVNDDPRNLFPIVNLLDGEPHLLFDAYYPKGTLFDIYVASDPGDQPTLEIQDSNIHPALMYNSLMNLGFDYISLVLKTPGADINFGYCDLDSDGFIKSIKNDVINKRYILELAPNPEKRMRKTYFSIRCGNIIKKINVIQLENPDGFFFSVDTPTVPPPHQMLDSFSVKLNLSEDLKYNVVSVNGNYNNSGNPYKITLGHHFVYTTTIDFMVRLNYPGVKVDTQQMQVVIELYDPNVPEGEYYSTRRVTFYVDIEADGIVYNTGGIYVKRSGEIISNVDLGNAPIVKYEIVSKPDWINSDDILVDLKNNIVNINSIEKNDTYYDREGDIEILFYRTATEEYKRTTAITVTQESNAIFDYYRTWQKYIIKPETSSIVSVYSVDLNKVLYNGMVYGYLDLGEFAKQLFYDKPNIFDSVLTDLHSVKTLEYTVNGQTDIMAFFYDYNYNDYNNYVDITDLRQPIDYYVPRQYVVNTIHNIGAIWDMKLNDVNYSYEKNPLKVYNNYNITLYADQYDTVQLTGKSNAGIIEGKIYKRKDCHKAKYAVYYMNILGGWNWMLFEGNKQLEKESNSFSSFLGYDNETINYRIDTNKKYELTSLYLTDKQSELLKDLYKSPMVFLHDLTIEEAMPIRVNVDTKNYTVKTYINQGRKFFTQSITLSENKNITIY